MRLTESERKIMEVLWAHGELTAKETARLLEESLGWKKTTTYTMLTRCEQKKYLKRTDPHFVCTPLITKEQVSHWETDELLKADFNGSADLLVASLVGRKKLNDEQVKKLHELLHELEDVEK